MNTICINNMTVNGNRLTIKVGKVYVDGKEINTEDSKTIHIEINGNIDSIEADHVNTISVTGNAGSIKTMAADVRCGDVSGNVQTMSGDIKCGQVAGNVSSMSGDIDIA